MEKRIDKNIYKEWDDIPEIDLGIETSGDWISLWEAFKRKHKLTVELPYKDPQSRDEQSVNAFIMLINIVSIRRGKWRPDWEDEGQEKHFPWFWMNKKRGGAGGFSLYSTNFHLRYFYCRFAALFSDSKNG